MSFRHWRGRFAAVALAGLLFGLPWPAGAGEGESGRALIDIGIHRIDAELAISPEERSRGLMRRTFMASGKGMLFVFPSDSQQCMWMKNTLIPLSVAFIDAKGKILNIEDMEPETEDTHCAKAPARYALEMNMGWFAVRGIKPGMAVGGLERIGR